MDKAVILAAGAGTRLRKADPSARLSEEQAQMAAKGIKAMVPIGRPFLDFVLSAVADAGYRRICLVIGPRYDELRAYYRGLNLHRLQIDFAVQHEPLGTAHALASAHDFAGEDPFLVINSDNCYPVSVLRCLREATGPAVAGFERHALIRGSNIPAERVASFAILRVDGAGNLVRVMEKPDPQQVAGMPDPILISMNCWRFSPAIFDACRWIAKSARGEFEIPDAVMYSIQQLGQRYQVYRSLEPVLDLSNRQDIETLRPFLASMEVDL